ncbi:hypothetical protein KKD70_00480 [Patescibacteria group bacterium]|nr:hypothetical protein [Patescibacteria group bacterium]
MKRSLKTGLSFGLTSGITTTLGLIVGLNSGTHSKLVVIGGILTIAIADAASDALGIHISEESKTTNTTREIWEATISTFLSKVIFTLSFVVPVLLFELEPAIIISIIWGMLLIGIFSFYVAKTEHSNPTEVVIEHLAIMIFVIIATNYVGSWVSATFG